MIFISFNFGVGVGVEGGRRADQKREKSKRKFLKDWLRKAKFGDG